MTPTENAVYDLYVKTNTQLFEWIDKAIKLEQRVTELEVDRDYWKSMYEDCNKDIKNAYPF